MLVGRTDARNSGHCGTCAARGLRKKEEARPKKEGEEKKKADCPWDQLDEMYRQSNRIAADHIPIKLRAIGLAMDNPRQGETSFKSFQQGQVELLAKMEHNRWWAELLLLGRTHPNMVPWEELDEETKEFDRGQVRAIPQALKEAKLGIYSIKSDPGEME